VVGRAIKITSTGEEKEMENGSDQGRLDVRKGRALNLNQEENHEK
jgi:hypothetical protein